MPSHWSDQTLADMRMHADPLADQIITALVAERGSAAVDRFFHQLIGNLRIPVHDIPEVVRPFLEQTDQLPSWTEPSRMDTSAAFFVDHGPKLLLLLFFKSLPLLYAVGDGAKVLIRTGRLAHDAETLKVFSRRIAETGQFLIDVMAPTAFEADASGFRQGIDAIQKVRLIHASIRHFVRRSDWDVMELGIPVNQTHLAVTLMTFSIALTDGLAQFGLDIPSETQESYLHRWKAIGHLLGIQPALLPDDTSSARTLLNAILTSEVKETEDGKLLTRALVEFTGEAIPRERLDATPEILITFLVGEDIARKLGVTPAPGCLGIALPAFLSELFNLVERLEDKGAVLSRLLDTASATLVQFLIGHFREEKGATVIVPEALRLAWGLR